MHKIHVVGTVFHGEEAFVTAFVAADTQPRQSLCRRFDRKIANFIYPTCPQRWTRQNFTKVFSTEETRMTDDM